MAKEDNKQIVTTLNATTDHVRCIKEGISSRVTPTNLATILASLITGEVKVASVTAAATAAAGVTLVDSSSGDISIALPTPASVYNSTNGTSKIIYIAQKISGGNTVTINRSGSENIYINGAADTSIALTGGSSATLISDGTNWTDIS